MLVNYEVLTSFRLISWHQKNKSRDHVMVRGFWGDIMQSPYIPFGLELWKEPEATLFKKQINFQQVYSSRDFSDYNL